MANTGMIEQIRLLANFIQFIKLRNAIWIRALIFREQMGPIDKVARHVPTGTVPPIMVVNGIAKRRHTRRIDCLLALMIWQRLTVDGGHRSSESIPGRVSDRRRLGQSHLTSTGHELAHMSWWMPGHCLLTAVKWKPLA